MKNGLLQKISAIGLAVSIGHGFGQALFPDQSKKAVVPSSSSDQAIPAASLWMRHSLNFLKASHERLVLGTFQPRRLRLEKVPMLVGSPVAGRRDRSFEFWLPVLSNSLNPLGSSDQTMTWRRMVTDQMRIASYHEANGDLLSALLALNRLWEGQIAGLPKLSEIFLAENDRRVILDQRDGALYLNETSAPLVAATVTSIKKPLAEALLLNVCFHALPENLKPAALRHLNFAVSNQLLTLRNSGPPDLRAQGLNLFLFEYALLIEVLKSEGPDHSVSDEGFTHFENLQMVYGPSFNLTTLALVYVAYARVCDTEGHKNLLIDFLQYPEQAKAVFVHTAMELQTRHILMDAWGALHLARPDYVQSLMVDGYIDEFKKAAAINALQHEYESIALDRIKNPVRWSTAERLLPLIQQVRSQLRLGPWFLKQTPGAFSVPLQTSQPLTFRPTGPFALSTDKRYWDFWLEGSVWHWSRLTPGLPLREMLRPDVTKELWGTYSVRYNSQQKSLTFTSSAVGKDHPVLIIAPPSFDPDLAPDVPLIMRNRQLLLAAETRWKKSSDEFPVHQETMVLDRDGHVLESEDPAPHYLVLEFTWSSRGELFYEAHWPFEEEAKLLHVSRLPQPEQWIPSNFIAALDLFAATPMPPDRIPLGVGKALGPQYIEKRKKLSSEEADHWVIHKLPTLETAHYFSKPLREIVLALPPFDVIQPEVLAREMIDQVVRLYIDDHTSGFFGRSIEPRRLPLTVKHALEHEVKNWTMPKLWLRLTEYIRNREDAWDDVFESIFLQITIKHEWHNEQALDPHPSRPLPLLVAA